MDIIISNASGKPIYEQITEQIKEQIMSGELNEGDPLPSMRALAQQLRISMFASHSKDETLATAFDKAGRLPLPAANSI